MQPTLLKGAGPPRVQLHACCPNSSCWPGSGYWRPLSRVMKPFDCEDASEYHQYFQLILSCV